MSPDAHSGVARVLSSGYIGQGPVVDDFEDEFSKRIGSSRRVVSTNSCTSAIDLALRLCGIGVGDLVVSTPMTCLATNVPVVNRGAKILWADVDPKTGLICCDSVRRICKQYKIKAVMAVDWGGLCPNYGDLRNAASGAPVIEDAAHCFDLLPGRPGGHGDYVAYSFQAIKFVTAGDGGALLCPDDDTDKRARLLRWFGFDRTSSLDFRCQQNLSEIGYKYHLNDIAAVIGLANLPLATTAVNRHIVNAAYYDGCLGLDHSSNRSPWLYGLTLGNRDEFIRQAAGRGIACSQVHTRNDGHDGMRAASFAIKSLPGVDFFSRHQVNIPVGWWLTEEDRQRVAEFVLEFTSAK